MFDAVPDPVFPEAEAYPAYRVPVAIDMLANKKRIDEYVLAAVIATGTRLVAPAKYARKSMNP